MPRNINDTTTGWESCINNGLPGEVMRKSMENKNLLTAKGSMYVGTGASQNVVIADVDGVTGTYSVKTTEELKVPTASGDYALCCSVTSGGVVTIGWKAVNSSGQITGSFVTSV